MCVNQFFNSNLFKNKLMLWAVGIGVGLQILVTQVDFLNVFF